MMKLELQIFAVPFRKVSKTRGRKRRTHYKISENATVSCSKCGAAVRPHRVCKECGTCQNKNTYLSRWLYSWF